LFEDYYLPDVLHAAILSLFFLCLFLRRYFLTFICLLLLAITRESTLLLALIVIALSIQRRQWALALGAATAAIIGLLIARHVASFGQSNIHGLNDLAYMVLKVPYNFLHNVLGIVLWADTLALRQPLAFPDSPIWMIHVPQYFPSGSIHSIGIYGFDPSYPGLMLIYLLSVFGVMPSILARELCNSNFRKSLFSNAPFWLLVALFYGAASFLLGTVIGASIGRLIGYGWPCFFIAFPFILRQRHNADGKFLIRFWLSYLVAAWLPYLVGLKSGASILIVLLILLAVHLYVLREANCAEPFERR
jgi:hypothetical protein